jgi:hypothetical protein
MRSWGISGDVESPITLYVTRSVTSATTWALTNLFKLVRKL